MASTPLVPLAMSQTKEYLLRHLNMSPDIYILMAKEADRVYQWLTSDIRHLKKNCKHKPPYEWSDIVEKSKDEAMIRICQSSGQHTTYYWNLAVPTEDCPNWIARWFLYHKFRYRDGRNHNPTRRDDMEQSPGDSTKRSKHSKRKEKKNKEHGVVVYDQDNHYLPYYSTTESSPIFSAYRYPLTGSSIQYHSYSSSATDTSVPSRKTSYSGGEDEDDTIRMAKRYYDPVRDL